MDKNGKAIDTRPNEIIAGDSVIMRPTVRALMRDLPSSSPRACPQAAAPSSHESGRRASPALEAQSA